MQSEVVTTTDAEDVDIELGEVVQSSTPSNKLRRGEKESLTPR